MKTFKFALMCAATLAMIACEPKNPVEGEGEGEGEEVEYVSPISITDGTLADWDALPADFVFSATGDPDAALDGLKSIKVYADEMYINLAVEYNPETITDLSWPGFHVYIDTDNNAATGGFGGQWSEAAFDVLLETGIFSAGEHNPYNPGVFYWWGEVGASGWEVLNPELGTEGTAENKWGAIIGEGEAVIGNSQLIGNVFEIQLMWEAIPTPNGAPATAPWGDVIKIGVDIQQNWATAGLLPNGGVAEDGSSILAAPLTVKFNK